METVTDEDAAMYVDDDADDYEVEGEEDEVEVDEDEVEVDEDEVDLAYEIGEGPEHTVYASPPLQYNPFPRVKRRLFQDEPAVLDEMSLLGLLDTNAPTSSGRQVATRSVLRDFSHYDYLYAPSLTLKIKRTLYLGNRCFLLLLSDSYCCKWVLVIHDQQMMEVALNFRETLHNMDIRVRLHKRTPEVGNAFLLATNIRVDSTESDDDLEDYFTHEGVILPGSAFGQAAVGAPYSGNPTMLMCNGPRVDPERGEMVMSFVNKCIHAEVWKEEFGARLCVLRVYQSQILLSDGTHSMIAFFADELRLLDGVFVVGDSLSPKLRVGDVLDVQAYGYSHDKHMQKRASMEHYPTCIVSKCSLQQGREPVNARMLALTTTALDPLTDKDAELAARSLRRLSHEAARVRALVAGRGERPGLLLQTGNVLTILLAMLRPFYIFRLCLSSKVALEAVLSVFADERLIQDSRLFLCLLRPRAWLALRTDRLHALPSQPLIPWNVARDSLYIKLYAGMSGHLLRLSLSMATGGLAKYQSSSVSRVFSLDRVFGRYIQVNMQVCRCLPESSRVEGAEVCRFPATRCVRCEVRNEYRRYLWALNTSPLVSVSNAVSPSNHDFNLAMRLRLSLRHRYMFRHRPAEWQYHDNLRRLMPLMPSNFLVHVGVRSHVEAMEERLPSQILRTVPPVKNFFQRAKPESNKSLDHNKHMLAMQNWLFPLVPGCLRWLEKNSKSECAAVLQVWAQTVRSADTQTMSVDVVEFMPARPATKPHVRIVLQITNMLLHGVRILYVQRDDQVRDSLVIVDSDFVSFWAHDGLNELAFSTECPSFMLMLDEALLKQELDSDFHARNNMHAEQDILRTWVGSNEPNVLVNYIVAFSVHDVCETAHVNFSDVFGEEYEYTTVLHEQRAFDFEILDTKVEHRNFIEKMDPLMRNNRFSSQGLFRQIMHHELRCENDDVLLAKQHSRRMDELAMTRAEAIDGNRDQEDSDEEASQDLFDVTQQ